MNCWLVRDLVLAAPRPSPARALIDAAGVCGGICFYSAELEGLLGTDLIKICDSGKRNRVER